MDRGRREKDPSEKMSGGRLMDGVIVDILKRVSVKDLVRFTTVASPWYDLITSQYFISLHTQHAIARNNDLLLVRAYTHKTQRENYSVHFDNDEFGEFKPLDFPFKSKYAYFKVVGCVNGVVCLSDDNVDLSFLTGSNRSIDCGPTMVLWNPSIMKSVTLPCPNWLETVHDNVGFGFDSANNDYKVVRVCPVFETDEEVIEVYELSTGSWRIVQSNGFPDDYVDENGPSVYLNGAVHWMGKSYEMILSFDIASEVCGSIEVPTSLVGKLSYLDCRIEVLQETLSLVHCSFKDGKYYVWAMEKYGVLESWIQRFSFDHTPRLGGGFGFMKSCDMVLLETTSSEYAQFADTKLVSYSPKSEQLKDLGVIGNGNAYYVGHFVETLELLSLKGNSAKQAKIEDESTSPKETKAQSDEKGKSAKQAKIEAGSRSENRLKAESEDQAEKKGNSAKQAKIVAETGCRKGKEAESED